MKAGSRCKSRTGNGNFCRATIARHRPNFCSFVHCRFQRTNSAFRKSRNVIPGPTRVVQAPRSDITRWPSPEPANLFSAKSPGKVMNSFENLAGDPSKLSGRRGSKKLVWLGRGVERGGSSCLRMKPREEVEDDDDNDEKGEEEEEESGGG